MPLDRIVMLKKPEKGPVMKIRHMILISSLAAAVTLLTGCGGGEPEETTPAKSAPASSGTELGPASSGEDVGSAIGDLAGGATEKAKEVFEQFKAEYASQVDKEQGKVDALKATAQALTDDKLAGLFGSLDDKLASARAKLADLSGAEEGPAAALQTEIKSLLTEIPAIYDQAMARIAQLNEAGGGLLGGIETPKLPEK